MSLLDKCFSRYINLDYRTDRRTHMGSEFERVGINIERMSAIRTNDRAWNMEKVKSMIHRGTGGNVGCHYSQVSVMQQALENNLNAGVFEDDLIFCSDIRERFDYIEKYLDTHEWDVFFLGGTVHVNPAWWHKKGHSQDLQMCDCTLERDAEQTDDKRILRTYGAFSTHAYIVNKNSIEKILKYFDENVHLSMGIDWLFIKMQPQLKAFCFVPGCIIQMDNRSDIGHGMTIFSGFKMLGEHWYQDKMNDFNPDTYNWGEAKR